MRPPEIKRVGCVGSEGQQEESKSRHSGHGMPFHDSKDSKYMWKTGEGLVGGMLPMLGGRVVKGTTNSVWSGDSEGEEARGLFSGATRTRGRASSQLC